MSRLKIEKPQPMDNSPKGPRLLLLLVLGLTLCFIGGVYFLRPGGPQPDLEAQMIKGQVLVTGEKDRTVTDLRDGDTVKNGVTITTQKDSETELVLYDRFKMRVKPESELVYGKGKGSGVRVFLKKGTLLIATKKEFDNEAINIATPFGTVQTEGGYLSVGVNEKDSTAQVGVLRGVAKVAKGAVFGPAVEVRGLETVKIADGGLEEVQKVTREQWEDLREVYELTAKSAELEAEQLDISAKAGSLFQYVFDHGTFYTPKYGYSGREFFRDSSTGEVILESEYDVFPVGSFAGMYIKTRDLDISKFDALEFEMKQVPDEGHPRMIRIELKGKSGVVRAFAAKLPKVKWEKYSFPLHVNEPTLITEIALVYLHDRVGEDKKGSVQIRNINLVSETETETAEAAAESETA